MVRTFLAVAGGLAAWMVVATVLNIGLRVSIPGYIQAEPLLAFTLTMKIARLSLAVIAGLSAGAVVRSIAPSSKGAPWIVGLVMLLLFLPVHIQIWPRLPIWYHLFFLITLAPLVPLGAYLRGAGCANLGVRIRAK
jgi:hypothetical protein